jgi:serine/threonine-protein kinase HipA
LSPAYDINPTPLEIAPHILTTSIDFKDNTASLKTAMRVRLKKDEALLIIKEVASSVKQWRQVAAKFGLSKQEYDRMLSAFVYEESDEIYHK